MTLAEHLRAGAEQPFAWGTSDCCLYPSDWILAQTGIDAAAPLRGRYRTPLGAARHIKQRGGFIRMVSDLMAAAGFAETADPQPGDVGVIHLGDGFAFAIRTRLGWASKSLTGLGCGPFRHVVAWTIPRPGVRLPDQVYDIKTVLPDNDRCGRVNPRRVGDEGAR